MKFTTKTDLEASKPSWAKAAIFAEYEADKTDTQTDYFATSTERRVFLGWSKTTRDSFAEMRKAAARFAETAHLGPGKDIYTVSVVTAEDIISNGSAYWKGTRSHWHQDTVADNHVSFTTQAEADAFVALVTAAGGPEPISFDGVVKTFELQISKESVEHREKYSLGKGYYLKGSHRYSDGWTVRKTSWFGNNDSRIEIAA